MTKEFIDFFTKKGLTVEQDIASGIIDDINVKFYFKKKSNDYVWDLRFHGYLTADKKALIIDELNKKYATAFFCYNEIWISIMIKKYSTEKTLEIMEDAINDLLNKLKENEILSNGYCPFYGTKLTEENTVTLSERFGGVVVSKECQDFLNNQIDEANKEYIESKNHWIKGFFGAFLAFAIGSVISLVLCLLKLNPTIGVVATAILVPILFFKFNNKLTILMPIFVVTFCIILAAGSFMGYEIYDATRICIRSEMSERGFDAFKVCMDLSEQFRKNFRGDIVFLLIITALSIFIPIYIYFAVRAKVKKATTKA